MELDTAMKIAIMAIMPYSAGVKRRANIKPTKKVTPELDMLSIKLHFAPWTALFFKDSGNIVTNYYSISSTSDACTNVVATAITPSMFTTTLRSWHKHPFHSFEDAAGDTYPGSLGEVQLGGFKIEHSLVVGARHGDEAAHL